MRVALKRLMLVSVLACSTVVAGCSGSVGVGVSVGVPIGNHGYMSVGTSRWR
jgi:hypothetical protein